MGIAEDLTLLDRNIEKLKSDYDQYFQGVQRVPPHTTQTAVERLIRKYTSGGIHNSALRFRYQNLVARFNSLTELWNRRMRMKEEGIMIGAPQKYSSHFLQPNLEAFEREHEPEEQASSEPKKSPEVRPPEKAAVSSKSAPEQLQPERPGIEEKVAPSQPQIEKKPERKPLPTPVLPADKFFSAVTRNPGQEKQVVDSIYDAYVKAMKVSGGPEKKINQEGFHKMIAKQVDTIKKSYNCNAVDFRIHILDGEVKLKAKPVK